MIYIISAIAGVLGMLSFWALAWWLWRLPDPTPLPERSPAPPRQIWQNEPTPEHRLSTPPPAWVFGDADDATQIEPAPEAREHADSSEHTSFYVREDSEARDKTEILDEHMIFEAAQESTPPPVPTDKVSRKTWMLPRLPRPK